MLEVREFRRLANSPLNSVSSYNKNTSLKARIMLTSEGRGKMSLFTSVHLINFKILMYIILLRKK
jgi:hypothetical protein